VAYPHYGQDFVNFTDHAFEADGEDDEEVSPVLTPLDLLLWGGI
jgi:hypothetical protein